VGYLLVTIDKDADNGMGEVKVEQPEPFDIYVDPKSRDMLFRDAAFIMVRKVLPKNHLEKIFPGYKSKIRKASSDEQSQRSWSERSLGDRDQKLFQFNDASEQTNFGISAKGEMEDLAEFFEVYEKIKVSYMNVFYRIPPSKEELQAIKQQCDVMVKEMQAEMQVKFIEQKTQMEEAVQSGKMLPERYQLELQKAEQLMGQQLQSYQQECMSKLQAAESRIDNTIITEKEFKLLQKDKNFQKNLVEVIQFYDTRVKQTCCVGDQVLYENIFHENVKEYPLIPIHYKWTGTPFPISAVSPLIGKQQEINKAHQIMVHNASLGSSLRWMYEEGSIDAELWEKYSASPGALLPIRPGVERPTPVMPAPLANAFFQIVQESKGDMEYLAGIYSSMMGDAGKHHDTYKGMLALDEYGTRRIKQWMQNGLEPSLKQVGTVVMQIAQSVYTANKRFQIIQPNAIKEEKEVEINIPVYNDMGEAIGKSMDFSATKFDVRIVAGSTMPVNRWAYLEELKQLMQLGVVDDVAVLAETDIRNKENIVKRKSLYSQLQGKIGQMEESLKDSQGTIETLERQLVQAGIKNKVMQADVEINKEKEQIKTGMKKEFVQTQGEQKLLRGVMNQESKNHKGKLKQEMQNLGAKGGLILQQMQNNLQNNESEE
jgi:hypothetical protein